MGFSRKFWMQPKWRSSIGRRTRSGNHPEENLAKSGYKLNMKHKVLILLLFFSSKVSGIKCRNLFFWGGQFLLSFFRISTKKLGKCWNFFFPSGNWTNLFFLFLGGGDFWYQKDWKNPWDESGDFSSFFPVTSGDWK